MTSTPESVPEPRHARCGSIIAHGPHLGCDGLTYSEAPPAASSPDEGGEWVCVAGSPLACNETSQHDAPGHERCGPPSADEGAPEGCEIDPVSSRGCERGTPGCVTQHADEGARQRPGGELVAVPLDELRHMIADYNGLTDPAAIANATEGVITDNGWTRWPADAAPPAPSTHPDIADLVERLHAATGIEDLNQAERMVRLLMGEAADALAAASTPAHPADEGTERPDTAALLTIGDWLLRTLPGHQGAEQTAAVLACTARWIDAQPPVPPPPAPQADRAEACDRLTDWLRATHDGSCRICGMGNEYVDQHAKDCEAAPVLALAAAPSAPVERPQPEPGALVLGTEDRFHLWAKLYEIQQEAGLCRFGGRNYDPQLDHIYEEATTALAYFEPPAPTDGEP